MNNVSIGALCGNRAMGEKKRKEIDNDERKNGVEQARTNLKHQHKKKIENNVQRR